MIDNEVTIKAIQETLKQIAFLLGGANVILVSLITWLGKRWMDKILESERRKTQIIVEQLKDSLTQEREKLNQVLKTQLDQSRYFFEQSISFFSSHQKVLSEKRFSIFEMIWDSIYEIRNYAPFYLDFLLKEEYESIKENRVMLEMINKINEQELIDKISSYSLKINTSRIYIPPIIWQLQTCYRMIVFRPQILIKKSINSHISDIPTWYSDQSLRELIESILDQNEIEEFNALKTGQITWILNRIEAKILDILQDYISGDIALKEMKKRSFWLDKANQEIQEKISELTRKTQEEIQEIEGSD